MHAAVLDGTPAANQQQFDIAFANRVFDSIHWILDRIEEPCVNIFIPLVEFFVCFLVCWRLLIAFIENQQ